MALTAVRFSSEVVPESPVISSADGGHSTNDPERSAELCPAPLIRHCACSGVGGQCSPLTAAHLSPLATAFVQAFGGGVGDNLPGTVRLCAMSTVCLTLMSIALLVAPGASQAISPSHPESCAGVNYGGAEIVEARNITLTTACRVLGRFVTWLKTGPPGQHATQLDRCSKQGATTLLLHSFDGYKLALRGGRESGGLKLSRGHSEFEIIGYSGWPTGCGI